MVATLVFSRFVFSFRPSGQAWPEEEVPSRLRLSPKVSSPAMAMGALAAASHYADKSVVESAGQRTHIIPSPTCNPIRRQSSRALRLIPARDPLAYLSRLGGRCREVALRASAFGAGVDLEPMWAPKRRNNHRQAHFIATGRTVRAADLFCDPRCHDSLRSEPFPHKRPLAMVTRYVGTRCMARAKE
jgi:hypothetical protein